jgi:hypothetical protein
MAVYNYSWPLFPYVWNEIKFHVAYQSDLEFVAATMRKIVEDQIGHEMKSGVEKFRELLAQTPVDELEVREHPSVFFQINDNTWVEAIVRYLVHPKQAGRVKNALVKQLLAELTSQPDKVLFPKVRRALIPPPALRSATETMQWSFLPLPGLNQIGRIHVPLHGFTYCARSALPARAAASANVARVAADASNFRICCANSLPSSFRFRPASASK